MCGRIFSYIFRDYPRLFGGRKGHAIVYKGQKQAGAYEMSRVEPLTRVRFG
jgi:hypothetical protein